MGKDDLLSRAVASRVVQWYQLCHLVAVLASMHEARGREAGEVRMGFLPPQPRNDTLSFRVHWMGSISWPLLPVRMLRSVDFRVLGRGRTFAVTGL